MFSVFFFKLVGAFLLFHGNNFFFVYLLKKKYLDFSDFSSGNGNILSTFERILSTGVQDLAKQPSSEQTGFQMAWSQHHLGLIALFLPVSQAQFLSYFDTHTAIANLASGPRPDSLKRAFLCCCNQCNITYHQSTETGIFMSSVKSFRLPNHLHSIQNNSPQQYCFCMVADS